MKKQSQLIIGYGEIGQALNKIFINAHIHDPKLPDGAIRSSGQFDIMHIAFPCFNGFVKEVKRYQKKFKPRLTIIHSTVPVGTTEQIPSAVHAPIRGKHPNLEEGIRTFVMFIGGKKAEEVANIFRAKGVSVKCTLNPRTTELGKLLDTEYFRECILFNKKVWKLCKKYKADFDIAYHQFNETYNTGYCELGLHHVERPVLKYMPGPIGGHCVESNHKLLCKGKNS